MVLLETTRSLTDFDSKTLSIIWPRILTQYSHFAATRKTDKLTALSGLAKLSNQEIKAPFLLGFGNTPSATTFFGVPIILEDSSRQQNTEYRYGHGRRLIAESSILQARATILRNYLIT